MKIVKNVMILAFILKNKDKIKNILKPKKQKKTINKLNTEEY